jgi:alpha-beta hydrolase superfamily lysophospholipase
MLTSDPEQASAYARDPLVVRAMAVSFFDQVVREQGRALEDGLPRYLPALVMAPEDDGLTDAGVTEAWAAEAGPRVETWVLPGTRHEPFTEGHRNKIFERLVEWLNRLRDGAEEEME